MNTYLKAEKMKYRHTFLWWMMILMPAVSAFLSAQLTHNYFAMDGYNWWYMLMMPGFLAVACSQIGGKDHKKQNRTIWVLPADMRRIWDAKVLLSVMVSGLATLFLTVFVLAGSFIMERGLHMTFFNAPSVPAHFFVAASLLSVSGAENRSAGYGDHKCGTKPGSRSSYGSGKIIFPYSLWGHSKSDVSCFKDSA